MPWAALARPVGAGTVLRKRREVYDGNLEEHRRTTQRFEAKPPHKGNCRGRFGSEALPHGL
jgi:hypothetical protein